MLEERPIQGFPGYCAREDGNIISYKYKTPYVMSISIHPKNGYANVKLCENNVTYTRLVHRLIAEAFIPNPYNLPEVNHKNKIRYDNRVSNLEWCTRLENLYDSYDTMGPTRNFIECFLIDPSGKIVGVFQSKLEASRFARDNYGCSESSLRKYGKTKGFLLQEM